MIAAAVCRAFWCVRYDAGMQGLSENMLAFYGRFRRWGLIGTLITSIVFVITLGMIWLGQYIWPNGNAPIAYDVIGLVGIYVSGFLFIPSCTCLVSGILIPLTYETTNEGGSGDDMRPGQLELNRFEAAILEELAKQTPSITPLISQLRVLSREFTGHGSFTNFQCPVSCPELGNKRITSKKWHITVPGVPNGMGALLMCKNDKLDCLETFTYGDHWDGVFEGFEIVDSAHLNSGKE